MISLLPTLLFSLLSTLPFTTALPTANPALSADASPATSPLNPGVYTLTNAATSLRLDLYLGSSQNATPIYGWCSSGPGFNAHQYWQMSTLNVNSTLSFINYGTGTLMAAPSPAAAGLKNGTTSAPVTGQYLPPYAAQGRWTVTPVTSGPFAGAVTLSNLAWPGWVLDMGAATWPGYGCQSGNQVVVAPGNAGSGSQAWFLNYVPNYS